MRLRQIVIAAILGCGVAVPAQADERAWFLAGHGIIEVAVRDGGREWTPVVAIALPPHVVSSPVLWGGGRYLLWSATMDDRTWLVRFDTRSRHLAVFPLALDGPAALALDRRTTRLLVLDGSALTAVDVERLTVLQQSSIPGAAGETRSLAIAAGRAFVGRHTSDDQVAETLVIDAASLVPIRTIAGVWLALASRDEHRVYLQATTMWGVAVQAWDTSTLALGATATFSSLARIVGDHLVSATSLGTASLFLADHHPTTLATTGTISLPQPHAPLGLLDLQQPAPHSAFVMRNHGCRFSVCGRSIQVYDRVGLTPVKEMREAPFDALYAKLVMLAAPEPMPRFNAVVNGRTALLSWEPLNAIGEYEVVIGTAPGRSDVGTFRTGGLPVALFRDVPAGTFYVRVRAVNEMGAVESPERAIFVP